MELIDVIKNRRSIREFKENEVSKDLIEDLINCARLAPSAKNRQPWKFVIVQNDIKNEIANIMLENTTNNTSKYTAKTIKEASILILVLKNKNDNWIIGDTLSIGAAIEHICLRATDLGLGSLWIRDTVYIQKEIENLIRIKNMEMICAVAIGYPNESPNSRPRKKLDEILEWYK